MITPYKDSDEPKVDQIRKMFNRIAPQYDRLNRIISLGLDRSWRRRALHLLAPYQPKEVLDVATGTGDLAIELVQTIPSITHVTAARELHRILRPSGVLIIVELSEPTNPILHLGYKLYAGHIVPLIGRLMTEDKDAYSYLPQSIKAVPQREQMVEILKEAGFREAFYESIFPGSCTIYVGINAAPIPFPTEDIAE